MEKLDAKFLKYVKRKKCVSYDNLIKKFGTEHFSVVEKYLFERTVMAKTEYPPYKEEPRGIGMFQLNDTAKRVLRNYELSERENWFKYWFSVLIPLFALAVSVVTFIVSVLLSCN